MEEDYGNIQGKLLGARKAFVFEEIDFERELFQLKAENVSCASDDISPKLIFPPVCITSIKTENSSVSFPFFSFPFPSNSDIVFDKCYIEMGKTTT